MSIISKLYVVLTFLWGKKLLETLVFLVALKEKVFSSMRYLLRQKTSYISSNCSLDQ